MRERVLDFVRRSEGDPPSFEEIDCEIALARLRAQTKYDRSGICVDMLRVVFESNPSSFVLWVRTIVSSEQAMSRLESPMLCFGKSASLSPLEQIRAIVPPGVLVKIMDRLLATNLGNHLARVLPLVLGCIFGAVKWI